MSSRGKIGIFLPSGNGDIMTAMSVLKYKDIVWPNKDIVWFCDGTSSNWGDGPVGSEVIQGSKYQDVLKYNDAISEIRHWPHGWRDAAFKDPSNNHLNQSRKHLFELAKDLEQGYFPAPWMVDTVGQRSGIDYPNFSRRVFGVNPSWEWHPYLCFSKEEKETAAEFCMKFPHKKTVMLETSFGSGESPFQDDSLTIETIEMCRKKWGKCNFIFACVSDNSRFFDDAGMVSCSCFTARQTALINNYCDLFIGVGSGISVAVSCWGNKPVPQLQYCGTFGESTVSLANGPTEIVVKQDWLTGRWNHNHQQEFKSKLSGLLEKL